MRVSGWTHYLPSVRLSSPQEMVNKLQAVAVPALILLGNSYITQTHATPATDCMDSCDGLDGGVAKMFCKLMCSIVARDG